MPTLYTCYDGTVVTFEAFFSYTATKTYFDPPQIVFSYQIGSATAVQFQYLASDPSASEIIRFGVGQYYINIDTTDFAPTVQETVTIQWAIGGSMAGIEKIVQPSAILVNPKPIPPVFS